MQIVRTLTARTITATTISAKLVRLGNHILPTHCLLCQATLFGDLVCDGCLYGLPWLQQHEHSCRQCALALESSADFCGHCLNAPPAFSRTIIPFCYEYPVSALIHRFKYRGKLTPGKLLGNFLAEHIRHSATQADWLAPDLLIPTPLHWARRWRRGFNQAEVLGQYVSRATGIPLQTALVRRRRSLSQKVLSRAERQKNLREAFTLSANAQQKIIGKRIALIDDVVTTTATVREISKLLIDAGAQDVQVWALARTMNT